MSYQGETRRPPAGLCRALRRGFRAAYDNLGWVVGVTFGSFAATAIVASITAWAVAAAGVAPLVAKGSAALSGLLVYSVCAVGASYYAGRSAAYQHPAPGDFWTGIRTLLWPALALIVIDGVVGVVLAGDAVFLLVLGSSRSSGLFAALGVLCAYLALVWAMMCLYHLPLLIAQLDMDSGARPTVVIRKAFLLSVDNPRFTLGLFLVIIAFAVLCALPALVGMAVIFLGTTAFVVTHALRELFVRYGLVEEEPEVVEDKPWSLPEHWRVREADQKSQSPPES